MKTKEFRERIKNSRLDAEQQRITTDIHEYLTLKPWITKTIRKVKDPSAVFFGPFFIGAIVFLTDAANIFMTPIQGKIVSTGVSIILSPILFLLTFFSFKLMVYVAKTEQLYLKTPARVAGKEHSFAYIEIVAKEDKTLNLDRIDALKDLVKNLKKEKDGN